MEPSREERFRSLAHRCAPTVGAYLRRRSYPLGEADVEELIASVLLVAWQRLDDVPEDHQLAWVLGVARNVLNNARRSHSRRQSLHARLVARGDEPSAEEYAVADATLRAALASLSSPDREVLFLHHWEGLDASELSIVLGISSGAAATRLSRAGTRLKERYEAANRAPVSEDRHRT